MHLRDLPILKEQKKPNNTFTVNMNNKIWGGNFFQFTISCYTDIPAIFFFIIFIYYFYIEIEI